MTANEAQALVAEWRAACPDERPFIVDWLFEEKGMDLTQVLDLLARYVLGKEGLGA